MKEFNTPAARTAVSCRLGLCVLIALSLSSCENPTAPPPPPPHQGWGTA